MKKTLVAIAALAAFGAQAQSSVTLDGYFDRGYVKTDNSLNTKDSKAIGSNAGTTTVGIKVVEDLGQGLKVGASINTDWSEAAGLTQDGADKVATAGGSFGNSQSFLYIEEAKLGKVQLGNINNEILGAATGISAPAFSTGVGSAYSSSWSLLNGYGTGVTNGNNLVQGQSATDRAQNGGVRGIRQVGTVKYTSPNIAGFNLVVGQALKNDNGTSANKTTTIGVTDTAVTYANGPLKAIYTTLKYKVGSEGGTNGTDLTANSTNTHSLLGASYAVLPTLTLHVGTGGSKASADSIANSKFKQYGVTYTMGQFDIMAQTASVNDKNATAYDRKMTGLGVNYNLSKTARAYVRYDNLKMNDGAATAVAGDVIKRTAIGISKSF